MAITTILDKYKGLQLFSENLSNAELPMLHYETLSMVFCHFPKCVLVHIRIKGEVGTVKLV